MREIHRKSQRWKHRVNLPSPRRNLQLVQTRPLSMPRSSRLRKTASAARRNGKTRRVRLSRPGKSLKQRRRPNAKNKTSVWLQQKPPRRKSSPKRISGRQLSNIGLCRKISLKMDKKRLMVSKFQRPRRRLLYRRLSRPHQLPRRRRKQWQRSPRKQLMFPSASTTPTCTDPSTTSLSATKSVKKAST